MATSTISNSYKYTQENYSTASSPVTKTFSVPIDYLLVSNVDTANSASISLDGTNYIDIAKGVSLELFPAKLASYKVKDTSSSNHASLQCVYGSEQ